MSKNFPFESHKKITLERVLLLSVGGTVWCGGFSLDSSCLLLSGGFVGFSYRGEKGLDVGRFTTSNSSSFHWALVD